MCSIIIRWMLVFENGVVSSIEGRTADRVASALPKLMREKGRRRSPFLGVVQVNPRLNVVAIA
jgi:hypothetical protein